MPMASMILSRVNSASGIVWLDAFVAVATACYVFFIRSRYLPLPPGPKAWPFIGNMFDMPQQSEWITYTNWGKKFGELVYVQVFGTPIVVINSFRVASALLEKRGHIYSDRPFMPMLVGLMKFDWALTVMNNGPKFRAHRRAFDQEFRPTIAKKYHPIQTQVARTMLQHILEDPDHFLDHIKQAVGTATLDIIYGYKAAPKDDEYIALADEVAQTFSRGATPGAWAVDSIPILRFVPEWMPGAKFKRLARKWYKRSQVLVELPFKAVKEAMDHGTITSCFCTDLLEQIAQGDGMEEQVIKNAAAAAYGAGVDTIISSISTFFLQMALHPEVQSSALEELERVCPDRLPQFSDRERLPYIECIVMETMRWHSVTPQGIPHRLEEEDVFEGMRVPKGSIVIANIWGMSHDEELYPSPYEFQPSRFMEDGVVSSKLRDPRSLAFGFGRRQCPGRPLADAQLFICVASVLAVFSIEKATDLNGKVLEPVNEYTSGVVSMPKPFKCRIKARNRLAQAMIRDRLQ